MNRDVFKSGSLIGTKTNLKVKDDKKETIFSELNSLLSSGLDFSRSFSLLIEGENDKKIKSLLGRLLDSVVGGSLLCEAMEESGRFSPLDQGVVRIGEETGKLNESLEFLSDYYKKKIEQRRMVSSAIRYPLIILFTAVIVVVFMMAVIVPMFEQVYSRMGGELPGITKWIISVSASFPRILLIFILIGSVVAGFLYYNRESDSVRSIISGISMNIPLLGAILRKNNQAHFCKLLNLLTSSSVPLLYGIDMLPSIITFFPYQSSFGHIGKGLRQGEAFYHILGGYPKLYDKKLVTIIRVGEETNRLPDMLRRQADELTKELEYILQKLGGIIEPLLILIVGVLVAVILISMYMPMFKLGGIMG